jgi:hypothetical protein
MVDALCLFQNYSEYRFLEFKQLQNAMFNGDLLPNYINPERMIRV